MHRLVDLLREIPQVRILSMQETLRKVWPRFSYLGVATAEETRRGRRTLPAVASAAKRDALATLLQAIT